jgi:hypothetical protein
MSVMKKILFLSVLFLWMLSGCQKESMEPATLELDSKAPSNWEAGGKYNAFYGEPVYLGNGQVRTFIRINKGGVPLDAGIEFKGDVFNGLPDHGGAHDPYILYFHPKAASLIPFDHVGINWEPQGHEPEIPPGSGSGPYLGFPHFDFHFYMISVDEQMMIASKDPLSDILPPRNQWPAGYFPPPGTGNGVEMMGLHWVDPSSPEWLFGQPGYHPFTHTFIYGSHDGKFIFEEPMVTRAFMQSKEEVHKDIPQPQVYPTPGKYYPNKYGIYFDETNKRHYVTLEVLTKR